MVYQQVIHKGRMVAEANLSALLGSSIVQKKATVLYKPLLTLIINKKIVTEVEFWYFVSVLM